MRAFHVSFAFFIGEAPFATKKTKIVLKKRKKKVQRSGKGKEKGLSIQ